MTVETKKYADALRIHVSSKYQFGSSTLTDYPPLKICIFYNGTP